MNRIVKLTVATVGVVALSGCASIKHGTYEKIEIVTSPPGAHCKIYRDGQGFVKSISTPGAKYIKRDSAPISIICKKRGYRTVTIENTPSTANASDVAGNIATAGIGLLFDLANGARYDLPEKFEIALERE